MSPQSQANRTISAEPIRILNTALAVVFLLVFVLASVATALNLDAIAKDPAIFALPVGFLFGAALAAGMVMNWSKVVLCAHEIQVTKHGRTIHIPLANIHRITGGRCWAHCPDDKAIFLHLTKSTPFGDQIRFFPYFALPAGSDGLHPLVAELMARSEAQRPPSPSQPHATADQTG